MVYILLKKSPYFHKLRQEKKFLAVLASILFYLFPLSRMLAVESIAHLMLADVLNRG